MVIKVMKRTKLIRLQKEIILMKMLDHPHVVKIYDVVLLKGKSFILMEYLKGGDLYDYVIKQESIGRTRLLRIFSQLVSGLLHCHEHSVVHRDLKLENILLDENGNVKIADFGLAQYSYWEPNENFLRKLPLAVRR